MYSGCQRYGSLLVKIESERSGSRFGVCFDMNVPI